MPLLSKPATAAYLSLGYITAGALIDVWSGIWYWYLSQHAQPNDSAWYWCYGLIFTGVVILAIGLTVGQIGRSARHAELPPAEATQAAAQTDQLAAANAPVAMMQPQAANGQVLMQPAPTAQPVAVVRG